MKQKSERACEFPVRATSKSRANSIPFLSQANFARRVRPFSWRRTLRFARALASEWERIFANGAGLAPLARQSRAAPVANAEMADQLRAPTN